LSKIQWGAREKRTKNIQRALFPAFFLHRWNQTESNMEELAYVPSRQGALFFRQTLWQPTDPVGPLILSFDQVRMTNGSTKYSSHWPYWVSRDSTVSRWGVLLTFTFWVGFPTLFEAHCTHFLKPGCAPTWPSWVPQMWRKVAVLQATAVGNQAIKVEEHFPYPENWQ